MVLNKRLIELTQLAANAAKEATMTDTNHIEQRARELLAAECNRTVEGMRYDAYGVVPLNVALSAISRALSAGASGGGELRASEALYGFAGWLTGLETPVTLGASCWATPAADMVAEYCKAANLQAPREDFHERIPAMPTGFVRAPALPATGFDWPEARDGEHDYQHVCQKCEHTFLGHKGRVVCRLCATPQPKSARGDWVMVPREPTPEMCEAFHGISLSMDDLLFQDRVLSGREPGITEKDQCLPAIRLRTFSKGYAAMLATEELVERIVEVLYEDCPGSTETQIVATARRIATPQPQQAPAQADDAAEQYRQAHNAGEAHGRVMAALEAATPPAHGDGEGVKIDYITAFNFAKDNGLDYNRLCAAVREMVTTRPTPEAQEAGDAALRMRLSDLTGVAHGYAQELAAVKAENAHLKQDAARLDFMQRKRVALIPEFEGPWDAEVYGEDGVASAIYSGTTPREAIDNAIAALALPAQGEGEDG